LERQAAVATEDTQVYINLRGRFEVGSKDKAATMYWCVRRLGPNQPLTAVVFIAEASRTKIKKTGRGEEREKNFARQKHKE
jgi:hypothetical protein